MSAEHQKSKAERFPALEEPEQAKLRERLTIGLIAHWIEIVAAGEARLGLARLGRPKYFLLLTIFWLAASPYQLPIK